MTAIKKQKRLLDSYLSLRRLIGALGFLLPVVVLIWGYALNGWTEDTISDYYSHRTRDVLVGFNFATGFFLICYKGYDRLDDWVGNIAGGAAICVALFPNSGSAFETKLHVASAIVFFCATAYFCLCLFTKSDCEKSDITGRKKIRNVIYRLCGGGILLFLVLMGLCQWLLPQQTDDLNLVFWLETAALWAFGCSWIIKGETLLKDR